jgi:arabinofuranosyltransferase
MDSGAILIAAARTCIVARLVNLLRRSLPWLAVLALALGLLAAVLRLAWLSDDAYITLRTVENLLDGHGPVWNPGERVQTYTHPAWFWLLVAARWLTGEHYFTTIAVSVLLTAVGTGGLLWLARGRAAMAALLLLLLGSRAFGDFATSGLETPLVTALLVWLGCIDDRTDVGGRRLFAIAGVIGLLGFTRLDLLVLAGPVLLAHARTDRPLQQAAVVLVAMLPLLGWSVFAAWYYGSPFPITAYAKAFAPGLPTGELIVQGLRYLWLTASTDPVTLGTIGLGLLVGFGARAVRGRMLALGVLLACGYVVRVGGDFMAGRFFVPPFVVALVLIARWLRTARPAVALALAGFVAGAIWLPGLPPWLRPPAADLEPPTVVHGIQDERRFYYDKLGLFSPRREIPQAGRFTRALERQGRQGKIVLGSGMAGGVPFAAGAKFHFVDPWLCDPLLMRLPVLDPGRWRIGHFTRGLPDGYAESIAFGDNRLVHPGLARFYTSLRTVLRAPLDAPERWPALQSLWLGFDDDGLRSYTTAEYRRPPRTTAMLAELSTPAPVGTFWFDAPTVRCIGRGGLRLRTTTVQRAGSAIVHLVPWIGYRFTFRLGGKEVGRVDVPAYGAPLGEPPAGDDGDVLGFLQRFVGLQAFPLVLPAGMSVFDTVDIDCGHVLSMDQPPDPWVVPAIGGLQLKP